MNTATPIPKPCRAGVMQLSDNTQRQVVFCSELSGANGHRTWEEAIRVGQYSHAVYGDFSVTLADLQALQRNFRQNINGQKVLFDYEHRSDQFPGSPFEVVDVKIEHNSLMVLAEWTEGGRNAVKKHGFRYLSLEYHPNYTDNEGRGPFGPVMLGGALTIRPFVKRMKAIDPTKLSEAATDTNHPEQNSGPAAVYFLSDMETPMNRIEQLTRKLNAMVAAGQITQTAADAMISQAKKLTEGQDEKTVIMLCDGIEAAANEVAKGQQTVTIQLTEAGGGDGDAADAPKQLSESEVAEIVSRKLTEVADQQHQDTQRVKVLSEKINTALDGVDGLDAADRQRLYTLAEPMLQPATTDDAIGQLADTLKKLAEEQTAARKLTAGLPGASGAGMADGASADGIGQEAQKALDIHLKGTSFARQGKLKLSDTTHPLANLVLSEFDRKHADELEAETRALSDGTTLGNTALPVTVQRAVIRETFADLKILELVSFDVNPTTGSTVEFPYEVREGGLHNYGIVAEGAGIPFAGVSQKMDTAHLVARKLAMKLTNEVAHFSKVSAINWDAMARTIATNAERMREGLADWITNELLRVADSYGAQSVTSEDVAAQLDGTQSLLKTAKFPLVQPFTPVNIRGEAVGEEQNPLTITVDGSEIQPWEYRGPQDTPLASGTYYRVEDWMLGLIRLVDQAGAAVTPNSSAASLAYSYAINTHMINTDDISSTERNKRADVLLAAIGDQQSYMQDHRQVPADFMLSSHTFNNELTYAEGFKPDQRIEGTYGGSMGDAAGTKGMPFWKTNRFNRLGLDRCILGKRGSLSVIMAKAFSITNSTPIEAVDSSGRPTGEKIFYGEEYVGIKVPELLKDHLRTVGWYSANDRAAKA